MRTIHLQGIGEVKANPASDIKVGDILIWNYGGLEKVKEIRKSKTGKTMYLTVEIEVLGDKKETERTIRTKRDVCILDEEGKYTEVI